MTIATKVFAVIGVVGTVGFIGYNVLAVYFLLTMDK